MKNLLLILALIFSSSTISVLGYKISDFSQPFLKKLGLVPANNQATPEEAPTKGTALDLTRQHLDSSAERYDLFLKAEYQLSKNPDGVAKAHSDMLVNIWKTSQAYQTHAKALFQCGEFEQISQVFNKIKIQDCVDSEFWLMSAKAFMQIGIESKADEIMDLALERFPDKEQVVYQKVMFEIKKDNFPLAQKLCKEFLAKSTPKCIHHIFYELLTIIALKIHPKAFGEAFNMLNKALELNPRSVSAYNTKIMILENMTQGNTENKNQQKLIVKTILDGCSACSDKQEADYFVKKLIQHDQLLLAYRQFLIFYDKTSVQDQVNACFLAFQSGQKLLAIKHATAACEQDSKNDSLKALVFKLVLSLDKQDVPEGVKNMLISQASGKKDISLIAKKALFHLAVNTQDKNLEKILTSKLSSKNLSDRFLAANLFFAKKEFTQALARYAQIDKSLPRGKATLSFRIELWLQIALCATFAMQLDRAQYFCQKAYELDTNSWTAQALMGVIRAAQGQFEQSIMFCNLALLQNSFHQEAQEALCWALMQKGEVVLSCYLSRIFSLQNPCVGLTLTKYLMIIGGQSNRPPITTID